MWASAHILAPLLFSANISKCPTPDNTRTHKKERLSGQAPSWPAGTFVMFVKEHTNAVVKDLTQLLV